MKNTPEIVKNYRGLALRTLSAASFLDKDSEKYCTLNQIHGAMGLVTEIQEIETDASVQEEISDCLWYCNILADSVGLNAAEIVHNHTIFVRANLLATSSLAKVDTKKKLNAAAIYLLDCAKASIFYGRELHKNLLPKGEKLDWNGVVKTGVTEAAKAIAYLCVIEKISVYETMERNITKLALRYPEKFDTDKASNRDVGKELGVFNGKVTMVSEPIGTVIVNPNAMVKVTITDDEAKTTLGSEVVEIIIDEVMPPETAAALDESVVEPYAITDEHAEEMNSHPADCANPAELTEDFVVIEEIPAEDIPADIQEKMDEVGVKLGEFVAAKKESDILAALNEDELAIETEPSAEFNVEALVEAVEETAEQVKADKKKPGRKKNN